MEVHHQPGQSGAGAEGRIVHEVGTVVFVAHYAIQGVLVKYSPKGNHQVNSSSVLQPCLGVCATNFWIQLKAVLALEAFKKFLTSD